MKDKDSSPSEEEDSEQEELVKELEALEAESPLPIAFGKEPGSSRDG